ncbi:MAG: WYL domain-containing protein [Firmicutes bacterium]|nr:WYL domain-containing protein [Bacillota bacterium]
MIFSEIYSAYYNTVAKILKSILSGDVSEKEILKIINQNAFSESVLTVLPAIKDERWQIINKDLSTPIKHIPTMPLTILEKRWLKAITEDPRIKLFGADIDLDDTEPLFTPEDYKVFDKYADGDPFEDEEYIERFRLILTAIKEKRPVVAKMYNRNGSKIKVRFFPKYLEYSEKDDKFRVIADGCRFSQFNLARFISCKYYDGNGGWNETPREINTKELTLLIKDERKAMERVMLHFAHFEKSSEKIDDEHYRVKIKYLESDETEIVIRVLSFGPYVKVCEPESFVDLIKERLNLQKSCGLK